MPLHEPLNPLSDSSRRLEGRAVAVAVIVVVALIWRSLGLRQLEVWRDEALTIVDSAANWRDLLLRLPRAEDTPPLNFMLYKIWLTFFPTELGARVLPVLAGVAAVGVLMAVAERMRCGSGWAVGLLAAFSYELLAYSQEIRIYSILVLLTALSFLATETLLARPRSARWQICLVMFAAMAAHAHAVGIFVFPMVLSYLVVRAGPQRSWRALGWRPLLVWSILVLPMIWFGAHWSRFHRQLGNWWNVPPDRTTIDVLFRDFSGLMLLRSWSHTGDWHMGPWVGFWLERVVMVAGVLLLIAALYDQATRRIALALLAAAFVYASLLTITSYVALPNVVERTALPGWVPLAIVLGLGATAGRTWKLRAMAGSVGLLLAAIWAGSWLWFVNSNLDRHDPNAAAFAWMRSRVEPSDLIISIPEGMEDLTVYRLGNSISADQLLGTEYPVYAGAPPRPMLIPRVPDPQWKERLERRIGDQIRNGTPFKVWIARRGLGGDFGDPSRPEAIVERTHMRVGRFSYVDLRGTTITEYVLRPAESRPAASLPVVMLSGSRVK